MTWWASQSEIRSRSRVLPPLAQAMMWWMSVRREWQPGNWQRLLSRSRTARRSAGVARRCRRPASSRVPSWSCSIQDTVAWQARACAAAGLMAGPSSRWQRRGCAGWPAGRLRRAPGVRGKPARPVSARFPRERRLRRARAAGLVGRALPAGTRRLRPGSCPGRFRGDTVPGARVADAWPAEQGLGADVHDHVVDVRVARGGDLPGQVRPGHLHQRIGQARPARRRALPGPGAVVRAGRGVVAGVRPRRDARRPAGAACVRAGVPGGRRCPRRGRGAGGAGARSRPPRRAAPAAPPPRRSRAAGR